MATVIPTSLDQIIPLIQTQLVTVTGLNAGRVIVSQLDELPYDPGGDQYLWLRIEDGVPDLPIEYGAGRVDTRDTEVLAVIVRSRLALDISGADIDYLTDASLGLLLLAHKVLDALIEFQPTNSNGDWLVTMPMKPVRFQRPKKDKVNTEWGERPLFFSITYQLALNQAVQ